MGESENLNEEGVLTLFRESSAMLEGHFQLSSGLHSDRFFQCARLLMEPKRAERLALALARQIDIEIDVVVGPAMGAMIWAHEMARALNRPAMFTERKDGRMCLRRGFAFEGGERVLVVEDVVTTGKSVKEVLEVLRELGAEPVRMGAILNRSGCNPFAEQGLELSVLAAVEAQVWQPSECPLCQAGSPAVKPGSRSTPEVGGLAGGA